MNRIDQIRAWLSDVVDPELGVNIVDLGLVYDIREEPDRIYVQMTLTTPGCPMHDTMIEGVRQTLMAQGISDVEIDLVWEPRWSPLMMSDQAKRELGHF
ncbi:metal-sulfur cluster assembly factor [Paenibacillus sanfengchensis]|uniref:metal-sulfur cluster assembly factor n=1 Tax=Paenibacillus TaxID=44249 RepID=UPI003A5BF6A7